MSTNVIMPQMGESIAEGTLLKWLKKPGEAVERDAPLFEISTDKVDAEIPSPASGILVEIKVGENQTVPINTVVAIIAAPGEATAAAPAAAAAESLGDATRPAPAAASAPTEVTGKAEQPAGSASSPATTTEARIRQLSSPLVRAIAAREGVDISKLTGSGIHGRVTKQDILGHLEKRDSGPATPAAPSPVASPAAGGGSLFLLTANSLRPTEIPALPPAYGANERVTIEPLTVMRRRIAENMVMSRRLNAHVTTFFEFDFNRVAQTRARHKKRFEEQHGVNLTYLPFLVKAVCAGLRAFPIVNAVIDGENVVYKNDVNIGMAVALDWGLLVPVVKNADQLSLAGVARAANDLALRARSRQLKVDELSGGTFTITNPGIFGGMIGAPIIPVGQSAIMGFGGIEKRPVVVETADGQDAIVVRLRAYMSISFDHRLIDGAIADQFMSHVKKTIETADWPELG